MLIEQFILLDNQEKQRVVSAKGAFLGYYEEGGKMSDIYKLFKFYVEFYYDIYNSEEIIITAELSPEELPTLTKIIRSIPNEDPLH